MDARRSANVIQNTCNKWAHGEKRFHLQQGTGNSTGAIACRDTFQSPKLLKKKPCQYSYKKKATADQEKAE